MSTIFSFLISHYGKKATVYYGQNFFFLMARYFCPYAPAFVINQFIEPMVRTAFTQVFLTAIVPGIVSVGVPTGMALGSFATRLLIGGPKTKPLYIPEGRVVDDDYVLL